jgi:hypothetical protein
MPRVLDPFRFALIAVAGWMNQHHLHIIDYLREETGFFVSDWAWMPEKYGTVGQRRRSDGFCDKDPAQPPGISIRVLPCKNGMTDLLFDSP